MYPLLALEGATVSCRSVLGPSQGRALHQTLAAKHLHSVGPSGPATFLSYDKTDSVSDFLNKPY